MAVRRRRPLARPGPRRRRADDRHRDAGARRPARGAGRRASASRRSSPSSGSAAARPTPPTTTARSPPRALPRRSATAGRWRGSRASAATCSTLFAAPAADGRVELVPSAATHAVLPLLATAAARRLQIDAGLRSHRRRFGASRGFWLPECAYEPRLEGLLADAGVEWFCVDSSAHEPPLDALAPVRHRRRPGRAADRLGGDLVAVVARRLPLRSGLCGLPPRVASRGPPVDGRRRPLRPRDRRPRRPPAGAGLPRRASPSGSSASPPSAVAAAW